MVQQAGQRLGFNSQNRDDWADRARRATAQALEKHLRGSHAPEILEHLGLATPFGPSLPRALRPTHRAHQLAVDQFQAELPRLELLYRHYGITSFRGGDAGVAWLIETPARDSPLTDLGFPIIGAFSPAASYELSRLIPAVKIPNLSADHSRIRQLLTEFVFAENEQWRFLGTFMPYSFRYRALSWGWSREAHQTQWAYSLCLKCGETLLRSKQPHLETPLCDYCVKRRNEPWPRNAEAPITRGTWWLRCLHPGCDALFESAGKATKCDEHKMSRITPSRRS
jgi:hypothetical protein